MQTEKRTVSQAVFDQFLKLNRTKQTLREAEKELEAQHVMGIFSEDDPNHPKYNNGYNYATGKYVELLGYEQNVFMAKQYK